MARPLRIQYPGAWYHVTSRGNERKAIFRSKKDRERFLSYLESAHNRYGAIVHVYCLMKNHYHILLETPRSNLSQILHHINGAYTSYFNAKSERSGHLFQGRYKAILVEKDAYCQELSRYIHLNPVRAGLVESSSEFPWSSYPYYIGLKKRPAWLNTYDVLGYFDKDESLARKHYRGFVERAMGTKTESPLKDIFASTFLGSEEFITWAKEKWIGFKNADTRNIPVLREMADGPSLEHIEKTVDSIIGREHLLYKKFCISASHQHGGHSLKEIGAYYGMRGSAVSQSSRRFKKDINRDTKLKKMLANIERNIHIVDC